MCAGGRAQLPPDRAGIGTAVEARPGRNRRNASARESVVATDFDDNTEYSADNLYQWWWTRRWADGPELCWVGPNPSTSETTGRPRPTLRKVVALARANGLGAVTVVNLFSWPPTGPADLKKASLAHDVVGERTDDVIVEVHERSALTWAAW